MAVVDIIYISRSAESAMSAVGHIGCRQCQSLPSRLSEGRQAAARPQSAGNCSGPTDRETPLVSRTPRDTDRETPLVSRTPGLLGYTGKDHVVQSKNLI